MARFYLPESPVAFGLLVNYVLAQGRRCVTCVVVCLYNLCSLSGIKLWNLYVPDDRTVKTFYLSEVELQDLFI